jgi:hypothetical protein
MNLATRAAVGDSALTRKRSRKTSGAFFFLALTIFGAVTEKAAKKTNGSKRYDREQARTHELPRDFGPTSAS